MKDNHETSKNEAKATEEIQEEYNSSRMAVTRVGIDLNVL